MSRWTTTELELLARLAPCAAAAEDLLPFFPRHPLGGARSKARRCGIAWPKKRRTRKL
jgi:hypothetical protein